MTSIRLTVIRRPQNDSTPPLMTTCFTVAKYGLTAPGEFAILRSLRMIFDGWPATMVTS